MMIGTLLIMLQLLPSSAPPPQEWWIVEEGTSFYHRVLGPFPTEELCRIAGEDRHPDDRRFWTAEQIAKVDEETRQKSEAQTARRNKEIAVFLKAKPKGGRLTINHDHCTLEYINVSPDGSWTSDSWAMACSGIVDLNNVSWDRGRAVTGCIAQPKN